MTADLPHRRMSFDRNAGNCHQRRPPYPQRVYALLADEYGLGPGCRIVEIGAGSGTATAELLDRGAQITAIEPGSAFVDLLRRRHPSDRLTVVQADFEHTVLPVASFDLAVAATSWHWVNPAIAIPVRSNGAWRVVTRATCRSQDRSGESISRMSGLTLRIRSAG